ADEHGMQTTNILASLVESTSTVNRSHTSGIPHSILIDESTYDIDVDYRNSTGTDKGAYIFYKDCSTVAGSIYNDTLSHTGTGSETFSIPLATHGLGNYNIIVQI